MSSVASAWRERLAERTDPYPLLDQPLVAVPRMARSTSFRRVIKLVGVTPPASILEAGIGSGAFSLAFAWAGYRVTALDCLPGVLAGARRGAQDIAGRVRRPIRFVCGDLEHPPLKPGLFDLVFNEGVIEHWVDRKERRQLIGMMVSLARPGGAVCVIVPNGQHPRHEFWVTNHYPGYESAPPMTLYGSASLYDDLVAAGLSGVQTDGLAAWQSFNLWPHRPLWRLPLGVLDRCGSGPRSFRMRYGAHLIACGRRAA